MENKHALYFSVVSGDIYLISKDEEKNLDKYQLKIQNKPRSNCKRCYGRGYMGRDLGLKYYWPCKCLNVSVELKKIE